MIRWRRMAWFLVLGLVTTVLVAWVANQGWLGGQERTIWSEVRALDAPNSRPDQTGVYAVFRTDFRGMTVWSTWSGYRSVALRDYYSTSTRPNEISPQWVLDKTRASVDWRGAPAGVEFSCGHAGLPWRALEWRAEPGTPRIDQTISGAIILRDVRQAPANSSLHRGVIALPWYPVWAGLIADIIFFAVWWWLVFAGLAALRRRRRRARGLCPTCGYALKGLAPDALCPECGLTETPLSTSTA